MFRRRWSALPAEPIFPSDLKQLGHVIHSLYGTVKQKDANRDSSYFVNNVDEIRNIDDPNKYFKFFISKNERWNERQRFAMNCE